MQTRPRAPKRHLHALTLAGCLLCASCASYQATPFVDDGQASSLIQHHEEDGLHAAVMSFAEERSCRKYFDRDLVDYGYVPVLILLELDSGSGAAFQIQKRDLKLCLRDGTRLLASDFEQVVDDVRFSHWRSFFGFVPLILPGFFTVSSVNTANRDLEADYETKSLRSVRISPNLRAYRGVAFFKIPEDLDGRFSMEDAFVEITTFKEGSRNEAGEIGKRLEFPVHFSR